MKKFKFTEIKKYKETLKQKEEMILSELIKNENLIKEQINDLNKRYEEIQNKIRTLYKENFNISLITLYNDNLKDLSDEIKTLNNKLIKTAKDIEKQKINLKNATIELKKFEKLEEIHKNKEKEKIIYAEKKETDEINAIREYHKDKK